MRGCLLSVLVLLAIAAAALAAENDKGTIPEGVRNSQDPKDHPSTPQEALAQITVPEGFRVTLFAGEPYAAQPISMCFDDRGRLWVAECYSYKEHKEWTTEETGSDRIVVFEDTDGDGRFDNKKVFWDKAVNLSSIACGFGGVWALCAPRLLFLPDADRDDVPDGPPQVALDGWTLKASHNIVNGLTWGPDGWLWGRHGILADSLVGPPGTPEADRMKINCGIWRFHPTRKVVEAVAHGTTNPWGLDFDDCGEAFLTNNVIGHLFHVLPGAHYKRMYGVDFNPYTYDLLDAASDHLHWAGDNWKEARGGPAHDELGGGHSHCGGMIYLGDNWPDEYRHAMYMCNTHGHRVNQDILARRGSGYVARHGKDFFFAHDPWFRGTVILYGPDGGVFISDWTDLGECHDSDGVHRTSGRIYKVVYGKPRSTGGLDLGKASNDELVALQHHKNDWYVRHARRLLQERAARGDDMSKVHAALHKMYQTEPEVPRKLRALWALRVTGGVDEPWLLEQLEHPSEAIRSWAVRLLVEEGPPSGAVLEALAAHARSDDSQLVRVYIAAALQRMPHADRWEIAEGLVSHGEDQKDANLPLMIWYGIEPAVPGDAKRALALAAKTQIPILRQYIAKRLAEASK